MASHKRRTRQWYDKLSSADYRFYLFWLEEKEYLRRRFEEKILDPES